jgi:hypothetical protein
MPCCIFARRGFDVFLLTLVEAAVFQQYHFAKCDSETAVDPVADDANRFAELGSDDIGDRSQGVFLAEYAFLGTAEVRGHQHCRARLQTIFNGGYRGRNAGIRSDLAVLDRDIEVGANENAFALEIEILELFESHGRQ